MSRFRMSSLPLIHSWSSRRNESNWEPSKVKARILILIFGTRKAVRMATSIQKWYHRHWQWTGKLGGASRARVEDCFSVRLVCAYQISQWIYTTETGFVQSILSCRQISKTLTEDKNWKTTKGWSLFSVWDEWTISWFPLCSSSLSC